jgi:hypothetical protein
VTDAQANCPECGQSFTIIDSPGEAFPFDITHTEDGNHHLEAKP